MSEKRIKYSVDRGVGVVLLNDPPANTYSYEMMRELDEVILEARMDTNVHVICLSGEGDKFFCAGANINMLKGADPNFKYWFCLHANETLNRLEQTPKLVVAALNGHTVGGGFEVALSCHYRLAISGTKLGLPEVTLGLIPGAGGTQLLPRVGGIELALKMITSGKPALADSLVEHGVVDSLV